MLALAEFRINCLFMVCSCSFFVLFEPTADNGSCKCFDTVASDTTQQSATVVKLEVGACLLVFGSLFVCLRRLLVLKSYLLLTKYSAAKQQKCAYLYE